MRDVAGTCFCAIPNEETACFAVLLASLGSLLELDYRRFRVLGPVCPAVRPSVCLSVRPSVRLSLCLCLSLSDSLSLSLSLPDILFNNCERLQSRRHKLKRGGELAKSQWWMHPLLGLALPPVRALVPDLANTH